MGDDLGESLVTIIDGAASSVPDRLAMAMDDGSTCSYGELRDEVQRWAATLAGAGVGEGDRVALVDWGGVRSAAVTLAAAHLGAVTTQMNPLLTSRELAELVDVSGGGLVGVAGADGREKLDAALGPGGLVLDRPDPTASEVPPRAIGGDAAAVVLFTSGTTGLPKAVPLSHRAALDRIRAYRPPFDAGRPFSVSLMCVPSFHIGGMLGLLVALYGGDTTVVLPRFDAGRWLTLVAEHQVVSAFVVPTMLARILDHPDLASTDTSSLRMISYGAAAAPVALVERALARWPDVGFANTFGQTETIGAYTSLSPADHRDPRRIGSVGQALAGVEVKVVDPEGREVTPGDVGEIWVRSVQVVPASGTDLDDGWLHTGDLARMDADGYLYPLGPHVRHHQPGRREVRPVGDRRSPAHPPGGGRRGGGRRARPRARPSRRCGRRRARRPAGTDARRAARVVPIRPCRVQASRRRRAWSTRCRSTSWASCRVPRPWSSSPEWRRRGDGRSGRSDRRPDRSRIPGPDAVRAEAAAAGAVLGRIGPRARRRSHRVVGRSSRRRAADRHRHGTGSRGAPGSCWRRIRSTTWS